MKHLWRALVYLRDYWVLAAGTFLGLVLSTAARLGIPRVTQMAIDDGIVAGRINIVVWASIATVGMALIGSLFSYLQGVLAARTAQGIAYDLRNQLWGTYDSLVPRARQQR